MRYRIEVRAQRGDQPSYHYVAEPRLRPGKVQGRIDALAMDTAAHERLEGYPPRFDWGEDLDGYATVLVTIGDNKFYIYPVPVTEPEGTVTW